MPDYTQEKQVEILSEKELEKTLKRLASQVLESVSDISSLLFLGIPTRGVHLSKVLAFHLETLAGQHIQQGSLDPTFHRDDLLKVGTKLGQITDLPSSVDDREIVLIDDVIFTGRTIRASLEALQSWGRPRRVMLLTMVDRGNREVPIQPDFCGRKVPTSRDESIEVRLKEVDGEEGVFLCKSV